MRTDRELLELAAKAAGHEVEFDPVSGLTWFNNKYTGLLWNPLANDGDALRLAVTLRLDILQDERSVTVKKWCPVRAESILLADGSVEVDRLASTCRVIVLAAAEIGAAM